ncbi:MAG TPA: TMEM165/GDT1 family protein [Acidimicrobiales bacterium]|nr:TMEM165/GDT1 family protein [Acidimicrobiales bacterium]
MDAFVVSLAVVFVAEIGDKSQLMALSFATRLSLLPVLAGIICSTVLLVGLSVLVGSVAADVVPGRAALAISAALFAFFSLWTLFAGTDEEGGEDGTTPRGARLPFFAVFGAFTLAELGDKTMLATAGLAANAPALATWAGASTGMVGANLLAVALGRAIGTALPKRLVRVGSAVLFFVVGFVLAVQAVADQS